MPKQISTEEKLLGKLDTVIQLLQDLFILDAARAGLEKPAVRSLLGIDMNRVTRLWQHIKKTKA